MLNINEFQRQVESIYDDEKYSVRDNGAVLRHCRSGKRLRPNDHKWLYGKPNLQNGYLYISQTRIHGIVATAFHGKPPESENVVDHIDTNRQNNRPENLRWVTRLENALNNPITRSKIEYLCSSVGNFINNPAMLNDLHVPNLSWVRRVTPEEATNCMVRLATKENSKKKSGRGDYPVNPNNSFSRRVFKPIQKWEAGLSGEPGLELASTPWCAHYMWTESDIFPCCPQNYSSDQLRNYYLNHESGAILACDEYGDMSTALIARKTKIFEQKSSIVVMCETSGSRWLIIGIELDKKSKHFIHFILNLCSRESEAESKYLDKSDSTNYWTEAYATRVKYNELLRVSS